MAIYLGPQTAPPPPAAADNGQKFPFQSTGGRSRCKTCIKECLGDGYKGKKDELPKMTTQCQRCEGTCCKKHLIMLCGTCAEKADFSAQAAAGPPRREVN